MLRSDEHPVIDAHSTRLSRWLRERRLKIALWIAAGEGLIVALAQGVSRWTVLFLAIALLVVYMFAGRNVRWDAGRQIAWIVAASQILALLVVILVFVVKIFAVILVIAFALIALGYLFLDLRRT